MSKIYGTNETLIVEDFPDSHGELEVNMSVIKSDDESVTTWLNKEEAEKLIEHLKRAFRL